MKGGHGQTYQLHIYLYLAIRVFICQLLAMEWVWMAMITEPEGERGSLANIIVT